MELIRKIRTETTEKGYKIRYGIFKCSFCLREIERQISNGLRDKSCGCVRYKLISKINTGKKRTNEQNIENSIRNTIHGGKGTKLYGVWCAMKQRILNIKHKQFKDYGGRGIIICDEWLEFIPFRDWSLSHGYQVGLEINRIENNGNYEPSNCNFVTSAKNCQNKECNVIESMEKANEIRELSKTGLYTHRFLAKKFSVSKSTITLIINNKSWVN